MKLFDVSEAGLAQLEKEGFKCKAVYRGPRGAGKSAAAAGLARQLKAHGYLVRVYEGIDQDQFVEVLLAKAPKKDVEQRSTR